MKKILLSMIGAVAMAAPAVAADLPAQTYAPPPPPMAVFIYDWTGFYIGGNGGWASSPNCWGIVQVAGAVIADGCADRSGRLPRRPYRLPLANRPRSLRS